MDDDGQTPIATRHLSDLSDLKVLCVVFFRYFMLFQLYLFMILSLQNSIHYKLAGLHPHLKFFNL